MKAPGQDKVIGSDGKELIFNDPTSGVDLKQLSQILPQDRYNYDYNGEFPVRLFTRFTDEDIADKLADRDVTAIKRNVTLYTLSGIGPREAYGVYLGLGQFDYLFDLADVSKKAGMGPMREDGLFRANFAENTGGFILFDKLKTLYNIHDAGNFLTGLSFKQVGYLLKELQVGANINQPFNESDADERAVKAGFDYNSNK